MTLLGVAATINAMAVDYTAKAIVTLESESGYNCKLTLRQAAEYGALNGLEMNMEGRVVALYALNGTTKLQTAQAANFEDVALGLLADGSANFTLTVSSVAGAETLYLWDADSASYALTEGAVYHFTAASGTDEARFVLKKAAQPLGPSICFNYNVLEINGHAGEALVVKQGDVEIANVPALGTVYSLDLSDKNGRIVVTLNGQDYQIDANPAVTPAN